VKTALAALGVVVAVATYLGCTPSSPPALECDTKAESKSYFLTSGCGVGGLVTISTVPGTCALTVDGGYVAQIPSVGAFTGAGADGTFSIENGNWGLSGTVRYAFHPPVDETVNCSASPLDADSGALPLACSDEICSEDGEDSSCEDQLCTADLYPPDAVPTSADDSGSLGLGGDDDDDASTDAGRDASLDGGS
jgi:hypothetical protein